MESSGRQVALLLWKDFLIRKRKLITLGGIIWATVVIMSLYIVRINVDNQDFPHCEYPARALPSAGMLNFLQSFVCSVNNECSPLDQYQEVPTYENSKFTQIQRQFSPLLSNESVLDVAGVAPYALRLVATLAKAADEPTFIDIANNGLVLRDLFVDPATVQRYLSKRLGIEEQILGEIMQAQLSLQGILNNSLDKCSAKSLSQTFLVNNTDILEVFVSKICALSDAELQNILIGLLPQINYGRYIKMLGKMYSGLNGDNRIRDLGDTLVAVLKMTKITSFMPPEFMPLFKNLINSGTVSEFSYFNLTMINRLMDLFEPTFGNTDAYNNLRGITDTLVTGVQWIYKYFQKDKTFVQFVPTLTVEGIMRDGDKDLQKISKDFENVMEVFEDGIETKTSVSKVTSMLSNLGNLIINWLPERTQHDFLFYSTLIAKLIEGAHRVVMTNVKIEDIVYRVSQNNPAGVKILTSLSANHVGKIFDALTDAQRTQMLTSKINYPGQMFCDIHKLSVFFATSKEEANLLKTKLCKQEWKTYVADLINGFGIFEVKSNINTMASLLIQESLGKNTDEQLYSIDKDFKILNDFLNTIMHMGIEERRKINWEKSFNVTDNPELVEVIKKKTKLGNQILITIHGALAYEIVKQNPILEAKISPILIDATEVVLAFNSQLRTVPRNLVEKFKEKYYDILHTMLLTLLNENKTYKSLSTHSINIFCHGQENSSKYLVFPTGIKKEDIVDILCSTSTEIENALNTDSVFAKLIMKLTNTTRNPLEDVNWFQLINGLKNLYKRLEDDYPYVFEMSAYNMNAQQRSQIQKLLDKAKTFWFDLHNIPRGVHLSFKIVLRAFDLVDRGIFNFSSIEWLQIKQSVDSLNGLFVITDEMAKLVTALAKHENYVSEELPATTVSALKQILPNIPRLMVETADIIAEDTVDVDELLTLLNGDPAWPCSETSLSEVLNMSSKSAEAVKGFETILCMNTTLIQEWMDYKQAQKLRMIVSLKNISRTEYEPHLFLQFSENFDLIVTDVEDMKNVLKDVFNPNITNKILGEDLTFMQAFKYIIEVIHKTDDFVFRRFFSKVDTVFEGVETLPDFNTLSAHGIWDKYLKCSNKTLIDENCKIIRRASWLYTLKFLSMAINDITTDVSNYLKEIRDPDVIIIQVLGFNKNTGLYILYEKLPDFVGVLLNSYWDLGFMNQVRRASNSMFWDCYGIVDSMVIPPGSAVTSEDVRKIRPYVCPSFLFWISLPTGENSFLDVFAKPQNYFFSTQVQNLTSSYENAYINSIELSNLIADLSSENFTKQIVQEQNNIQTHFKKFVDGILSWRLSNIDPSYRLFNEINKKQFISTIYLTKITVVIKELADRLDKMRVTDINEDLSINDTKKLESDLKAIQRLFKQRSTEVIALHFDLLTELLWNQNENYQLVDSINFMCHNLKVNLTNDILNEGTRTKKQICSKNYEIIYRAVQNEFYLELQSAKDTLYNLIVFLENGKEIEKPTNIFTYMNQRSELVDAMKQLIKHSEDLGIAIYLKYLHSTLDHYNVILSFLSGEDWWNELKNLYHGPYADNFFQTLEKSFDIAEDVLTHLDKIRIVRLLRDINWNDTEAFCQNNVTLSDYLPDATGLLTLMKQQMCALDRTKLLRELPLLVLASQGYDSELKLSRDVNYTAIDMVVKELERKLEIIKEGPKTPINPPWVQEEKIKMLNDTILKLFSKETLATLAFGIVGNVVDASTLFLDNNQCSLCSSLTTWFKQLNLQLFKKQEYDSLLCRLHEMSSNEIYQTLKNDFHWDMAIKELISTRNYTKYEFNKSINEFLEQTKLHLLDDILSNSTKLTECLARDLSKNVFGNATLYISVVSKSLQLLRIAMPHLHEIDGIKSVPFFEKLSHEVAPNLHVNVPIEKVLNDKSTFAQQIKKIDDKLPEILEGAIVDLSMIGKVPSIQWLQIMNQEWKDICKTYNCTKISQIVDENINRTTVSQMLPKLQMEKFWTMNFITDILYHIENFLTHISRLLGVASDFDIMGLYDARITALLDFVLQILQEDTMGTIQGSLIGLMEELDPILKGTPLQFDLKALSNGLRALVQFKESFITNGNFKVEVAQLFLSEERIEFQLNNLGINNTNFWSISAPRLAAGYIDLKPLLKTKSKKVHIRQFVCQSENMSKVILPGNVDVVTLDEIYGAVVEQFCDLPDERAKEIIPVLIENLNFTFILDKVMDIVLTEVYLASNLTKQEGEIVISKYGDLMALLPVIQENIGSISDTLSKEPLFASLKDFSSLNGLLSSSEFLASAGNMMCGKPFVVNDNKFYKAIVETKDFSTEVDPMQIEVLPTDFCRSLYKDILSMGGGKIIWSFIKPLIMGKILYTPPIPVVHKIVEKANTSFALMAKMADLIHSFADSFDAVELLSYHESGVAVLRNVMNSGVFKLMVKSMVGDADEADDAKIPNVNIDDLFKNFGDVKDIGNLVKRASDLLSCMNLNRFHAMSNEAKLTNEAVKLTRINEFSAGLVFVNAEQYGENPTNVEYKIRMDIDTVPTTTRKRNQFWTPGPEASFLEDMRYFRGFVQVQDMIDKAIIELSENTSHKIMKRDLNSQEVDKWAVYTQQTPYPCYRRDYFQSSVYESQAMIVAFYFSFILTVSSAIRFIVSEKETGITMLMAVMGVKLRNQALSWFIASFIEMMITVTGMFAALKLGGILPHSDPLLLWLIMLNFGLSVVMFCYMLSKFFSSSSLGAVCAVLAYLITFMPYIIILSLEAALNNVEKIITSLSMSTAFCYSMLYVNRYETIGIGAHWDNVWDSPTATDSMSIGSTAVMVLFDSLLYFIIAWLVDTFFGPKTLKSNINNCTTTSEKAGVSIVNITKFYGEGSRKPKVALENVSIELHKGQITTLLGHNGAGKTTLIKIITGMLKPTKGHVIVRAEKSEGGATQLGVCPQHDVLFENLTSVEHLTMYAQLKSGLPLEGVRKEIENMLQVLSFGELAHEQAKCLSGGLRRRLCVALAFIAQPQLVLLDEPSSGVDPLARRDIWSLIVKLKENRTVLLTTHHLDEAELLSDQIVIMHKGQIHTVGSPIEIKRSLGNGYKLTVTYPEKTPIDMQNIDKHDFMWQNDLDQTISMEERSKQLLSVVTQAVKNAEIEDINGMEIEISIPFFDTNSLSNNFLLLCKTLEAKQEVLGFSSYNLDCSSLEQVFFSICQQVDQVNTTLPIIQSNNFVEYDTMSSHSSRDTPSKSTSTASIKDDKSPLVPNEGKIKGSSWEQYLALLHKRWLHYTRNTWLLFLLLVLPTIFVTISMGFSLIRPPADNEISLKLHPDLYEGSTEFLIPTPTLPDYNIDSSFAENVMSKLAEWNSPTNWTPEDTPNCECSELRQECDYMGYNETLPKMLLLPNTSILNDWLLKTQEIYIEKRYGGWSSSLKNNITNLIAWYNNKGHHAMPSYVNALNTAILKAVSGLKDAEITTYTHPLKISQEQLSKSTVLQHVADAGISGMLLIAVSLVPAGAAVYLVLERTSQQKRLQLLTGVTPAVYWLATLTWDMLVMLVNIALTSIVLVAFDMPVFVWRDNLPAICLLLVLFGFSCSSLIHVLEKLFTEASMANMILYCGNVFCGLSGLAILLILDIISESEATDNARWTLHKFFLLSPQFALGDALLEIAKNTVQAQVLSRFGMDTYKSPFQTDLILYHCIALVLVGIFFLSLNLAIEYNCFDSWMCRWRNEPHRNIDTEDVEVAAERKRVQNSIRDFDIRLNTIGNINAGFVDTECKKGSMKRIVSPTCDVAQCVGLNRTYHGLVPRVALKSLSLGIPPGQCTALLGQNGAGKSTTFSLLCGELKPSNGYVVLNGKKVTSRQLCSGLISYCPQSDAIDLLLTVKQTLKFYCKLRGISDRNEVIKRTLHTFELQKYSDQQCGTLSGGNKRKLCTAVAFMSRSPLVLLDEPTSGMDPGSRCCVARGVRAACAARRGVLLSTHALDDARTLARRVALLRNGALCALAPLDQCLQRFGSGYVVSARVERGGAARLWPEIQTRAPQAQLQALHQNTLQFLVPSRAIVDGKEVNSKLSDVFLVLAALQGACDLDDYTVNASSLDQMFLNFSDKVAHSNNLEPVPHSADRSSDDLETVTSL